MDIRPGRPYPMGATLDGDGVNFALFAPRAGSVTLALFGADGSETKLVLPASDGGVWHGRLSGIAAGQRYGFRVDGPWAPDEGMWANPSKLLIDPYAKALDGGLDPDPATCAHTPGDQDAPDTRDSAPHVPKAVVVDPIFDWTGDKAPAIPLADSVIYETHVKGLTRQHPGVPADLQGTYAGLATPPVIGHLTSLGVTAVELQPVHHFLTKQFLVARGLSNYWGYDTIGFFAPHGAYSSSGTTGQQVAEFKSMVKALHQAGIEVILDVVFNHTAEGDADGATVCFRGFDNASYYRLDQADRHRYDDMTGTGNMVDAGQPEALRLIMNSLRYWVTDMHVDGFRFDLAAVLARQLGAVNRLAAFFDLVYQDPVVSQVKLIAEPWDVNASDSYELGHFPYPWTEWNDQFRNGIRDFWRQATNAGQLATRLAGSSDVFQGEGLPPQSSLNFVTSHDGFTLNDLVSYNDKHNDANHEDSGTDDNRSSNCGVEGPTTDPAVNDLRQQQRRNFLATLMLAQGIPMMLGGDEIGRTQNGNNNGYCQDNATTWYDWNLDDPAKALFSFVGRVIGLRRRHPALRRQSFFTGQVAAGGQPDVVWLNPGGAGMGQSDWSGQVLGMWINGAALPGTGTDGQPVKDDNLLLLVNGSVSSQVFRLPPAAFGASWQVLLDTSAATGEPATTSGPLAPAASLTLQARSLCVLDATVGQGAGTGSTSGPTTATN